MGIANDHACVAGRVEDLTIRARDNWNAAGASAGAVLAIWARNDWRGAAGASAGAVLARWARGICSCAIESKVSWQ